jgi:hypothetical protein
MAMVIGLIAGFTASITARDDDTRERTQTGDRRHASRTSSRADVREGDRNRERERDDRDDEDDDDDRDSRERDRDDDGRRRASQRYDKHGDKTVEICHKENRQPGGKTIVVSCNAVGAHQKHGDTLGPCPISASR